MPVTETDPSPRWLDTGLAAINATCRALGPHAAVIVARGNNAFHVEVPQTLRSFCNIPVAQTHAGFDPSQYAVLARRWTAAGRTLQIVSDTPENVAAVLPGLRPRLIASVTNRNALEQTLNRPPRHYTATVFSFAIATVPLTNPSS
jgi:hypothetical protein